MTPFSTRSRVLFQGDSITDCGRDKQHDQDPLSALLGKSLGYGYAGIIGSQLAHDFAEGPIDIRNLGISGNRVTDLAARAQEHIWNLQPTHISILIGVNDTWHHFKRSAGVDHKRYERTYRHLLEDSRERFNDLEFILCEPFILPCGEVGEGWEEDLQVRRKIVAQLANDFSAVLVPFQKAFDQAQECAAADYWARDGVHPTPAGHHLMAQTWRDAIVSA
jgi:lysophospholipase L1-like esterase